MFAEMFCWYGSISEPFLEKNDQAIKNTHDLALSLERFFKQIEDAQQQTDVTNVPYTPQQIVTMVHNFL